MKRLLITLIITSGCNDSTISEAEAVHNVKQWIRDNKETNLSIMVSYKSIMNGEWSASYEGKGYWKVTSRDNQDYRDTSGRYWDYRDFIFNYFENSGEVEYVGGETYP
jgi:hypothetical protein